MPRATWTWHERVLFIDAPIGQYRLRRSGAVQRLNLRLFVWSQDNRILRLVHVQLNHIGNLFNPFGIKRRI